MYPGVKLGNFIQLNFEICFNKFNPILSIILIEIYLFRDVTRAVSEEKLL